MGESPGDTREINLPYLSMLISAGPIVDAFFSPRVEQPDIHRIYRVDKKLRFCSSLV